MTGQTDIVRVPFKVGALAGDLSDLNTVRFQGVRCRECGIALLSERRRCENCSSSDLELVAFRSHGTIFSFTVQRYAPPEPNALDTPWVPRALAWVDIDQGPRILSPIAGKLDAVAIGETVHFAFNIGWLDAQGSEVIAFEARLTRPTEEH